MPSAQSVTRFLTRLFLGAAIVGALAMIVMLQFWPSADSSRLSAMAGALAVVAAAIAALPSLRAQEIQEDALKACPYPVLEADSSALLHLRLRNYGAAIAYSIVVAWSKQPKGSDGHEVEILDRVAMLHPQQTISVFLGKAQNFARWNEALGLRGTVSFEDAKGNRTTNGFTCPAPTYMGTPHEHSLWGLLQESAVEEPSESAKQERSFRSSIGNALISAGNWFIRPNAARKPPVGEPQPIEPVEPTSNDRTAS